mmetsp:Transcript_42622/g.68552  ORF Transcript_42622/g.68552 Transcript_42622/m.68552 type:complete len:237 (+) Transcript_42622:554-1264(+)
MYSCSASSWRSSSTFSVCKRRRSSARSVSRRSRSPLACSCSRVICDSSAAFSRSTRSRRFCSELVRNSSSCSTRKSISRFSLVIRSSFFIRLLVTCSSSCSTLLWALRFCSFRRRIVAWSSAAWLPARAFSRDASSPAISNWARSSSTSDISDADDIPPRSARGVRAGLLSPGLAPLRSPFPFCSFRAKAFQKRCLGACTPVIVVLFQVYVCSAIPAVLTCRLSAAAPPLQTRRRT